ncbi:MAG: hypothetical protein WC726_03455 [Parcubacteria group bacterium]|jgi:hypothetical protein
MSGGNFADGHTSEESADIWGGIALFGRIFNKYAEESGHVPSGKEVERILSVVGATASVPTKLRSCSFPGCKKALNTYNQLGFCGACQNILIDEEDSPKRAELLNFLRQEAPGLYGRVLRAVPWKIKTA